MMARGRSAELWAIGDAEGTYAEVAERFGVPVSLVKTSRWTSRCWPKSKRRVGVSHAACHWINALPDRFDIVKANPRLTSAEAKAIRYERIGRSA